MANKYDLRYAIEILKKYNDQIIKIKDEVDPHGQLAGIYRHIGAFGTVKRPTKIGPAMMFENIKGFNNARVLIGLLSSRQRVGYLLEEKPENLSKKLIKALDNPIKPIKVAEGSCQEVVHLASEPDFDIRKILPAPTNTLEDAGPYITMGMCYATDPITGESDVLRFIGYVYKAKMKLVCFLHLGLDILMHLGKRQKPIISHSQFLFQ